MSLSSGHSYVLYYCLFLARVLGGEEEGRNFRLPSDDGLLSSMVTSLSGGIASIDRSAAT